MGALTGLSARQIRTTGVLFGVAFYLMARTFVLPGVPVLLGGDQGFFWMYADRILRGERVYRDFFQFTPPGTEGIYALAFSVFGPQLWVANATIVVLGVGLASVCFHLARGVTRPGSAALATAIFTVFVFGHGIDATHHWWSMLAVMTSVAVFSPERAPWRGAVAGLLLGIASFFTQTHGPAALLAFLVFMASDARAEGRSGRNRLEEALPLLASYAALLFVAGAYVVATAGAGPAWSCLVVYVWTHMRQTSLDQALGLPDAATWSALGRSLPYLIVYAIVFVGYAATPPVARRAQPVMTRDARRRLTLLWMVGMALLAEVGTSFAWYRLFAVSMPAVILVVWLLEQLRALQRATRALAWALVTLAAVGFVRSTSEHHPVLVDLPGGRVATTLENREKLPWLVAHVAPGDELFAAPRPSLYLQLGIHNPAYLDALVPGAVTSAEHVQRTIGDLENDPRVRWVLWSPGGEGVASTDPNIEAFVEFLRERFRLVHRFADGDQAWLRRAAGDAG
jgi:hypothetical protein